MVGFVKWFDVGIVLIIGGVVGKVFVKEVCDFGLDDYGVILWWGVFGE